MNGATTYRDGGLGSLWFTDSQLLERASLFKSYCGVWQAPLEVLATDSLTLSNSWLRFPHDGFILEVTNDLVIAKDAGNTSNSRMGLDLTGAEVSVGGDLRMWQSLPPANEATKIQTLW